METLICSNDQLGIAEELHQYSSYFTHNIVATSLTISSGRGHAEPLYQFCRVGQNNVEDFVVRVK